MSWKNRLLRLQKHKKIKSSRKPAEKKKIGTGVDTALHDAYRFFFPEASREYFQTLAAAEIDKAYAAYAQKRITKYTNYLENADSFYLKAYAAGSSESAFALKAAQAFHRVRGLDYFTRWLERVKPGPSMEAVEQYLADGDFNVRVSAMRALSASGLEKYTQIFGPILVESRILDERIAAIDALGQLGFQSAVPFLISRLALELKVPDLERRHLYRALGAIGGVQAEAALLKEPAASTASDIEKERLRALGRAGAAPAYRYFAARLREPLPDAVLIMTAEALTLLEGFNAVPLLIDLAAGTVSEQVRQAANGLLARIDVYSAPLDYLAGLLQNAADDEDVFAAVSAMNKHGYAEVRGWFHSVLQRDTVPFNAAAIVLQRMVEERDQAAGRLLIPLLQGEEDVQMISLYLDTLGSLRVRSALPAVELYMDHELPGVRFMAERAYAEIRKGESGEVEFKYQ